MQRESGEGGPFGAVIVRNGQIIGQGWNRVTSLNDPTAHAEILTLRDAAERVGGSRLDGAPLYPTVAPCPMCAGAAVMASLKFALLGAAAMVLVARGWRRYSASS